MLKRSNKGRDVASMKFRSPEICRDIWHFTNIFVSFLTTETESHKEENKVASVIQDTTDYHNKVMNVGDKPLSCGICGKSYFVKFYPRNIC